VNTESIRMALRGIVANRLRSALTMLGILIGVAAVIILVAVGSGSAAKNRKSLEALGSNTLTVAQGGFGFGARGGTQSTDLRLRDADVTAMADPIQAPSITAVVPVINLRNVSVAFEGASATPAQSLATNDSYADVRSYKVRYGSLFNADNLANHDKVVVLGNTVAKNLLGTNGDPSTLVGQYVKIGSQQVLVTGVLAIKGTNGTQDQDDIMLLPITTARDALGASSTRIDQIIVQAKGASYTTSAQNEVTTILLNLHKSATSNSYLVLNQASLLQTQDASNRTFTVLLGAVAAISLLVGGIGVMNIMLVTVTERTREIGIRKAIGARKANILGQFLVEAVLLSLLGGLLGVATGIAGSNFTIVGVKPVLETYSIVLSLGVALAVGLFFGIYPANRAASLRPIDALRYE
jgi:putative ABC transport system permease protein